MVPENKTPKLAYLSLLKTLNNDVKNLIAHSEKKQHYIMEQNWEKLNEISNNQIELNSQIDLLLEKINHNDYKKLKKDIKIKEIKELKLNIKKSLEIFREIETINTHLLKDAFFVAKQKVKNYFKTNDKEETYSNDLKKDNSIWSDEPLLLDQTI